MGRSRGRAPKGAPPDGCVRSLVVPCDDTSSLFYPRGS